MSEDTTPCPTCGAAVYISLRPRCTACKTDWWASREIWARVVRIPYGDQCQVYVSSHVADYGTPQEIADAIAACEARWRTLGRALREANAAAGPLRQHPGETPRAYTSRYYAMTEEERQSIAPIGLYQDERRQVLEMVVALQDGRIPSVYRTGLLWPAAVQRLLDRQMQAHQAAVAAREAEIVATPIDDEAWQRELKRRADLDAYFARPAKERVFL